MFEIKYSSSSNLELPINNKEKFKVQNTNGRENFLLTMKIK